MLTDQQSWESYTTKKIISDIHSHFTHRQQQQTGSGNTADFRGKNTHVCKVPHSQAVITAVQTANTLVYTVLNHITILYLPLRDSSSCRTSKSDIAYTKTFTSLMSTSKHNAANSMIRQWKIGNAVKYKNVFVSLSIFNTPNFKKLRLLNLQLLHKFIQRFHSHLLARFSICSQHFWRWAQGHYNIIVNTRCYQMLFTSIS